MDRLLEIVGKFEDVKVLVVGDIMLDKYLWGNVERISPEAPVQVVHVEKEENILGGAANLANNLKSLGAEVVLSGVVGKDNSGVELFDACNLKGIKLGMVQSEKRPTVVKSRVMSHNQQLIRLDYEERALLTFDEFEKLRNFLDSVEADVLIISDYEKGINMGELAGYLVEKFKGKPIIVDTKSRNYSIYKGATVLTPNLDDARKITNKLNPLDMCESIWKETGASVVLTKGNEGMDVFENENLINVPTKAREVFDVTGAGDTVAACLGLSLKCGASLREAAEIATYAASVVIKKVGTATCSLEELKENIKKDI